MTDTRSQRPLYWESARDIRKRAEELAALRHGINARPGTAPTMWRFYTSTSEGRRLDAEHYALSLFAVHQQSQDALVHRSGVPFASAVRRLHASGKFNERAVDRRFFAAVTAPELSEVAYHLRGLVHQLRSLPTSTPFDYTELFHDLARWSYPEARQRIQRRWGLSYYGRSKDDNDNDNEALPDQSHKGDS